jgi:P4 family phage/plasmid primase-like protien
MENIPSHDSSAEAFIAMPTSANENSQIRVTSSHNPGQTINFYHKTTCQACSADNICTNTHRTDFVGYEHANKIFNIIQTWHHPCGTTHRCGNPLNYLRDLIEDLVKKQGGNFFLNEYPEECKHLQYLDLDADIPGALLNYIVIALCELTVGGNVLILRNTVSRKVHLIMNVEAVSSRKSIRKKAIARYLRRYLYNDAEAGEIYTTEEWEKIFDVNALGIRSAFSAKVQDGKLGANKGVYAPEDVDVNRLSKQEKIDIILEYSIYNEPSAVWTEAALAEFAKEEEALAKEIAIGEQLKDINDYNAEKGSIDFLGRACDVSSRLINDFISMLPLQWTRGNRWKITLKHVKAAALLVDDFNPHYFLHEWSANDKESYDKDGNNNQYMRCKVALKDAGRGITWLRNRATARNAIATNLSRGDYGLALIFSELASDTIKIVSADCTCYLWNDASRLWLLRDSAWIGNEVSTMLEPIYVERIGELGALLNNTTVEAVQKELEKQIRVLLTKKERIMNTRPALDVVHKARPMLTDMDFITKINLQPDLLPIKDGLVVDLCTGETTPRLQSHNFTFACPVSIDRDEGRRQLVEQFMLDICCGDKALLRYFQVALGYSITGHVSEKAVFVWWGAGGNGKTVVMKLLKLITGKYCKSSSKCLFIKTKSDSKLTPEREVLKDTRLVLFSESAAGDELNDDVLKMVSGDDPIRANPKYRDEYEFESYAKLIIATNHKPKIDANDAAMVQRIKFIPFLAKFVDDPKEPNERKINKPLARRMETDLLNAFFTWVLDGAISWYKSGLIAAPTVMKEATAEYIAENDELGEFLESETEPGTGSVQSSALYARYLEWCRAQNILKPKGSKTFSQEMEKRPEYKKGKIRGYNISIGLKFRDKAAEEFVL